MFFLLGIFLLQVFSDDVCTGEKVVLLGPGRELSISDFWEIVDGCGTVSLTDDAIHRIEEAREFIDHLLKNRIKVYGLTTGFADLRDKSVSPELASELSHNIIQSHDAGIGDPLPYKQVLGSMLLRANSLAKGNSGFTVENLQILLSMINERIVPVIPQTGSLGASGDLAYLARLGRAMEGDPVKIMGTELTADVVLKNHDIPFAKFKAKEGLALTNGTPFLTAGAIVALGKLVKTMENAYALLSMTMNAVHVVYDAYSRPIQKVRNDVGQSEMAKLIRFLLEEGKSPFLDRVDVQDDYLFRCIPQIFGYQYELIHTAHRRLVGEMNAATDNPLVFRGNEVTEDVDPERIITFKGMKWAVLSGGNFHGEAVAQLCDSLSRANVKPILTLERHLTYLMNPARGGKKKDLPTYLVVDAESAGLLSGLMIVQYTGNALAHKIQFKGNPMTTTSITSANESEDIVSYGATAAQKFLEQVELMEQFLTVYTTESLQAYSIARKKVGELDEGMVSERVFAALTKELKTKFPITKDRSFQPIYEEIGKVLEKGELGKIVKSPLHNGNENADAL